MEQWLANPKGKNISRSTSTDSLHYLSARNSNGFVLSSDELDRLDVVVRQYNNNVNMSSSGDQKPRSNSIHSSGSFADLTRPDQDLNHAMPYKLSQQYEKLQIMRTSFLIKEQLHQSNKSKGSGVSTISQKSRSNSTESLIDMSILHHDEPLAKPRSRSLGIKSSTSNVLNHSRSHSVCLSKPGSNDSGTTSEDDEHQSPTSPISLKPRSLSIATSTTNTFRSHASSIIVVIDNSHLTSIPESEQLDSDDALRTTNKDRQWWSRICTMLHVIKTKQ